MSPAPSALVAFLLPLVYLMTSGCTGPEVVAQPQDTPELSLIDEILREQTSPSGVLFVIREYEEDALSWVTPRLDYYVYLLRARDASLPLAVVSHGDEMLALTTDNQGTYAPLHEKIRRLVFKQGVEFHVCGNFAQMNGLSSEDFPDYIDVVPFGPAQIADYQALGYRLVDLELTW